jgi:hypothetical protein
VGECRLRRSYQANFIAPRCNSRGDEATGLRKRSKNDFTCHPTPRTTRPIHRGDTAIISEMGPTIVMGSAKA